MIRQVSSINCGEHLRSLGYDMFKMLIICLMLLWTTVAAFAWVEYSFTSSLYPNFSCLFPEEREKPELLAESPARRKRVAQDSGKTEQQVRKINFLVLCLKDVISLLVFRFLTWRIYIIIVGKPSGSSALPNACAYEKSDGCDGRWIYSNT